MHLRSGKVLNEMACPNNSGTFVSSTQSNTRSSQAQSYSGCQCVNCHEGNHGHGSLDRDRVTAPAFVSTTDANTQPDLVASITPFTIIPMTHYHQVRTSLDNRFMAMQNFTMSMVTRGQPYGMPTSMMAGRQNNASTFADNAIAYTSYNAQLPSSSSIPGRNALPFLTIDSINFLRQQMDESNHEMVNC
jgi:hypothetical protein